MYTPAQVGELEIVLKISAILIVLAGFRYEMAIIVEDDQEKANDLTRLSIFLNTTVTLLSFLVLAFFQEALGDFLDISNTEILYAIPSIVWLGGNTETLIVWYNRQQKYHKISANRLTSASVSAGYKVTHPFYSIFSANGLVLGHMLGLATAIFHLLYKLPFKLLNTTKSSLKAIAAQYKNFPLYSMPGAVLNLTAASMPVFLLNYFDGGDATGHFAYAYKLSYLPLSMLAMALGQVFFERISRNKSNLKEANALSRELLHLLLALTAIPTILLFFWGEDLAVILLGETWREAGTYIESTILFYTAMFISNPFFCLFDVYQRLKQELIFNFLFLVGGAGAMYLAYVQGYDSLVALQWFSVIGIILRFGVLNYFFRLVGGYILPRLLLLSSLAGIVYYFIS